MLAPSQRDDYGEYDRSRGGDDHCYCQERSEKSVDILPFPRTPPGSLMMVFGDQGRRHGWNNYSCNHGGEVGNKWAGVDRGCPCGIQGQVGLTWHLLGRITRSLQIR